MGGDCSPRKGKSFWQSTSPYRRKLLQAWPLLLLPFCYLYIVRNNINTQSPTPDVWKVAVSTEKYPVINREKVLGEDQICGAGRLHQPWKENEQPPPENAALIPSDEISCPNSATLRNLTITKSRKKLTLFLIYYENIKLLAEQIDSWLQWPDELRQQYEFLLIDDGSQVGTRAMDLIWPNRDYLLKRLSLEVYEIEQDLIWNIGGARNLAATVVTTDYLVLSDLDLMVDAPVAQYLLTLQQQAETKEQQKEEGSPPSMLVFNSFDRLKPNGKDHKPHPAVMLSSKKLYWAIGGCDEDFVGNYGHTDVHFFHRARLTPGVQVVSTGKTMQNEGIPPIREVPDTNVCPQWAQATVCDHLPQDLVRRKRPRSIPPNGKLFRSKTTGEKPWSNEYLRFSFRKAILQPP